MKIQYFTDTDTPLMGLRDSPVAETRELDEDTTLDLDVHALKSATRTTVARAV
ncbi:MAG TPA: DUF2283 domain-containing protein [Gammaproteobacteria bacterium]|jgi:uncharacterized protein YuzE|nr:DUF2283 domain-containing protein [Gammaproteobacteria bacterium]